MQKDVSDLKKFAGAVVYCDFDSAAPLTNAPALHVTGTAEATDFYAVTTNKDCADVMNSPKALKLLRGLKLGR